MGNLQAVESFGTTREDGTPISVSAGQIADEGSWVAKKHPGAFKPLDVHFPADPAPVRDSSKKPDDEGGVEQATKKPGERRRKSSG